jgi:methylenetetrahydrofolate dehydrogenase (NADP+)/methenyltetrahydrofolate cyclohydrolase
MIQLPIFDNDPQKELDAVSLISPTKDVDCLTPTNLGLIQAGRPWILPATVRAVLEVLAAAGGLSMVDRKSDQLDIFDQYKLRLSWIIGKKVAVVGSRGMVGAPLISVLSYLGATVTGCHRQTWDLEEELKKADIVISAAGSPRIVKKEMIKEGAVVIDVGTSIIDGKVIGDVNHEVAEVASFITPVPGGVGPMTVAMLLCNFIDLSGSLVGSRPRSGSRICH